MKRAIVLGGVSPHIALIKNLKERGYEVVLVDYYENPPAKPYADEHIQESTLNRDAIIAIAKERKADLIITTCVDHANVIMTYAAEQLDLPHPYSYETALNVTDKGRMKRIMKENDVPTSDFMILSDKSQLDGLQLTFPMVIKPVDNNGSKGVKKVDSMEELYDSYDASAKYSKTDEVIIEGFNEGSEIQIDCYAYADSAEVLMVRKKLKMPISKGMAMQSFGSIIPPTLSEKAQAEVQRIADGIAKAFNLQYMPFFIQAIVKNDDIKVIEFSPRLGGGLSYKLIHMVSGFNLLDAAIDAYFRTPRTIDTNRKPKVYATQIVYAKHGEFDHVEGFDALLAENMIETVDFMVAKGDVFGTEMESKNRCAAYIVCADTKEEVVAKINEINQRIDIKDPQGNSLLVKMQLTMSEFDQL